MALPARLITAYVSRLMALLALLAGTVLLAPAAHAEDGYKYWGYYQYDGGSWAAATKGADALTPADGALEGWHFAITTTKPDRPPRTEATFGDICEGVLAPDGRKRVAVAIDYGSAAEAPDGAQPPTPEAHCAVVPTDANGLQVLQSVAQVRVEGGLGCAINGFPASGCGTPVSDAAIPKSEPTVDFRMPSEGDQQAAAAQTDDDGGTPWPLFGVGAVVLLLGAGALAVARRRA